MDNKREKVSIEQNISPFEQLAEERDFGEKIEDKVFYAGVFVDKKELYDKARYYLIDTKGRGLKNTVEQPHVTTNFQPNAMQLHLDSLGSRARIIATGYGNNGKNEGLLVKIVAEDPEIQAALDKLEKPHITLSSSDDSHPMYTPDALGVDSEGRRVEGYRELGEDEQFEISGRYGLYMEKDDNVVYDKGGLEEYLEES